MPQVLTKKAFACALSTEADGRKELEAYESPAKLIETLDVFPTEKPKFLTLADPMSCDVDGLLKLFNGAYPRAPMIGGLASGPALRKPAWLLAGGEAYADGTVG